MRNRWLAFAGLPLFTACAVVFIALLVYPVRSEITRTAMVLTFAGADTGLLLALAHNFRRRWPLALVMAPQLLLAIFLTLPGRPADIVSLRSAYLAALCRYDTTRYVWGGENHLGVDCSGLLRASLVEAHLLESARTLNPQLLRTALWLWWHDASAREMSLGYRGNTIPVSPPATLGRSTPHLMPGDFAVTADGSHVLAYLGNQQWIEADPSINRVHRFRAGPGSTSWDAPVIPVRWTMLQTSSSPTSAPPP